MSTTSSRRERPALKIFLSSPGDVNEERVLANRVMQRLAERYAPLAILKPVIWEHEPLLATSTFQDQIEKPSATDIVVCILWSRLGTRLPAHITREDGSRYDSGTEFEFEDAWRAMQETGRPDLLVYRKLAEPLVSLADDAALEARLHQKRALDGFIQKWFHDQDGSLLAAFHGFSNSAEFEEAFETHLDKLIQRRLEEMGIDPSGKDVLQEPGTVMGPLWEGSPFRGLESFQFEHAPVFYGRTHAISGVLDALRRQASAGQAFVMVLGRSGGGKSSLVRAGVMPLLVEPGVVEGVGLWRRSVFHPSEASSDLFEAFAAALTAEGALPELLSDGTTRSDLAELLRDNPKGAAPLLKGALSQAAQRTAFDMVEEAIADQMDMSDDTRQKLRQDILDKPPQARLALLIDQFEELFTDAAIDDSARNTFIEAVAALARSGRVFVVATLRSDFYHRSLEIPALAALKGSDGQFDLMPPTAAEIGQIIRQPAFRAGLSFEEHAETGARLDDTLRDVAASEPDSLPLLEFTLEELHHARAPGGVLTWDAYDALGGVAGALGRRAEETYGALDFSAKAALSVVMRQIVHVGLGQDQTVTKRPAKLEGFSEGTPGRRLIDAFVDARLFVVDGSDDGAPVVTLTHEALLSSWPRLRDWLEEDREYLRIRARVAFAADRWEESGRDAGLLIPTGLPLEEARRLKSGDASDLSEAERSLIRHSEIRAQRGHRLRQLAVASLAALAVMATAAAWYANGQRLEAARNSETARTAEQAAQENAVRADAARERAETNEALAKTAQAQAETAREAALAAEQAAKSRLNELFLEQGRQALINGRIEEAVLILGAAYAGDTSQRTGALFNSALDIATIRGTSTVAHADAITTIASNANGLVATASEGGELALHNLADGRTLRKTRPANGVIQSIAFQPDRHRIAAGSDDGSVFLWTPETGELVTLRGHFQSVTGIAFSPDGALLASQSYDKTTRIWSTKDGSERAVFAELVAAPVAMRFADDGKTIVTVAGDGRIAQWNIETGSLIKRSSPLDALVIDAVLIGDLAVLATASQIQAQSISGDGSPEWQMPFSTIRLATASNDTRVLAHSAYTAILLDPQTGSEHASTTLTEDRVASAHVTTSGGTLALLDTAGRVTVSDGTAGRVLATIQGHESRGTAASLTTEGSQLVTGASDGTMRFWDLAALEPCQASGDSGRTVAFSPDGTLVATGDAAGRLRITDAQSCTLLHDLAITPSGEWTSDLEFSPDGAFVAATAGNSAVIVNVSTGKFQATHKVPEESFASSVAWSADGTGVIVGNRALRPWKNVGGWEELEPQTGAIKVASQGSDGAVSDIVTKPYKQYLLTRGRFGFFQWWRDTGEYRRRVAGSTTRSVAVWPSGHRLAVGTDDGNVRIIRTTSSVLLSIAAHDTPVTSVAINVGTQTLATGSEDGEVALWNAETGQSIARLAGHNGRIAVIEFVPQSNFLVSAAEDGSVTLWDSTDGGAVARFDRAASPAVNLSVSADGRRFSVATGRDAVEVYDIPRTDQMPSGIMEAVAQTTPWGLTVEDALPEGRWQSLALQALFEDGSESGASDLLWRLSAVEAGRLAALRKDAWTANNAWDAVRDNLSPAFAFAADANAAMLGGLSQTLELHDERVEEIAFSPDGSALVSVDWTGLLGIWDSATWTPRHALEKRFAHGFDFAPNGQHLLLGRRDGGVAIVDIESGETLLETDEGNHAVWADDGNRIAVFPRVGPPVIRDAATGDIIARFPELANTSSAFAITSDFSTLAASSDAGVHLIDVVSRARLVEIAPPNSVDAIAEELALSPDARVIAVIWSDDTASLHRMNDGALLFGLPNETREVQFALDMTQLVADISGDSVQLIEMANGQTVGEFKGALYSLNSFLPGDRQVATTVSDVQGLLIYDRSTGQLTGGYANQPTGWGRIAGSPDGEWHVTVSGDGRLRLWDTAQMPALSQPVDTILPALEENVLARAGDGRQVLLRDRIAVLTRSEDDLDAIHLDGHRNAVATAAFSATGDRVFTGGTDGRVLVWDAREGTLIHALESLCGPVSSLLPTAKGAAVLVACQSDGVDLIEASTGRKLLYLPILDHVGGQMAISDDATQLFYETADGVSGWAITP